MTTPAQTIVLRQAGADDADAIAHLHTESWRRTYRGMMSDDFLDHRANDNRRLTWRERLDAPPPNQHVRVAVAPTAIVGFICAFADHDPVWGSYIDNLHVIAGMHRQVRITQDETGDDVGASTDARQVHIRLDGLVNPAIASR